MTVLGATPESEGETSIKTVLEQEGEDSENCSFDGEGMEPPLLSRLSPEVSSANERSGSFLLVLAFVFLWLQIRFPSQAWPELAPTMGLATMGLGALAILVWIRQRAPLNVVHSPAFRPWFPLVLMTGVQWFLIRHMGQGMPPTGTEPLLSLAMAVLMAFIGWTSFALAPRWGTLLLGSSLLGLTLACGFWGTLQKLVLYPKMLAEAQAAYGATRDPVELGILHHLALGRVAGPWGDPNIQALACLLGLPAAWVALLSPGLNPRLNRKSAWIWSLLGFLTLCMGFLGLLFSGSRGGILGLLALIGVAAVAWWKGGVRLGIPGLLGAVVLGGALGLAQVPSAPASPDRPAVASFGLQVDSPVAQEPGTWWDFLRRQDTIRERLHYWGVGWRLIGERPFLGHGAGVLERRWGQLKPVDARETRSLHNWPLSLWMEQGLWALAGMIALLAWGLWRGVAIIAASQRLREGGAHGAIDQAGPIIDWHPWARPQIWIPTLGVTAALFWLDALYQLSFQHREMLQIAGLLGGAFFGFTEERRSRAVRGWFGLLALGSVCFLVTLFLAGGNWVRSRALLAAYPPESLTRPERDPIQAQKDLLLAARLAPSDSQPWMRLADWRERFSDPRRALEALEQAARREPWRPSIAIRQAGIMAQLGMEKEALAALERGLQAYPSHSRLHRVRAEVYLRFGHRDKAIEAARRAVEFGFLDLEQDRQFLLQLEGGRP